MAGSVHKHPAGAFFFRLFVIFIFVSCRQVVLTPIGRVAYKDTITSIGSNPEEVGPALKTLYNRVRSIQNGDSEDKFGWMVAV